MNLYTRYLKRIMDMFMSGAALLVLSPVLLVVAMLVRLKIGSPVFFTQQRPGRHERIFELCKFRTMTDDRDKDGSLLPDSDRITPFGALLRRTSLDELPELWNVLKGDMSIVGPRPLLTSYLPYYTDHEKHRHDVRPGLSGLAQISGRNSLNWDDRLAKDVEYVNAITFAGDLRIILITLRKVLKREDVIVNTDLGEGNLAKIRKGIAERQKTDP